MAGKYDGTLNLPDTGFPMRASLAKREPEVLCALEALYLQLLEKRGDAPTFILHDGPPFSNGDIHIGHSLNRILKDFIVRYKAMSGYKTPFVPGWDNHGMPIESAIIKKTKLDRSKLGIVEFRDRCRDFAMDFVNRQREQMKRLGVLGDWDNPYLTMSPEFEAEEVRVFGEMYHKGYIYKGLKPVYWCPKDETALAEAEIEYAEDKCTSVYVKFPLKDGKGKIAENNTFFVIWTTTPWTLPGNLAIAVNPSESYVAVEVDGETLIVAEALLEATMKAANKSDFVILHKYFGRDLEHMTAHHPFLERESLVCLADYVTMESGTGCVHTAPGFGADDYVTGRKYKLPMVVPVDDRGIQTEEAGKFAGMYYEKSNAAIVEDLEAHGYLWAKQELFHQYPHCWRCKSPIIFRATPQWFCSVEAFRDETIRAISGVDWIPEWGEERLSSMVRDRADWCISRQRKWGMPIPVFYCESCGKPVCTPETTKAVSDLFRERGSNAWYEEESVLPSEFRCPHCGDTKFTKESDTLDGWFDSGSTHFASLRHDNPAHWPADLYVEGPDQYRGWFQSSLLTSVAVLGDAPYKAVIRHGWTVDGEGKAMHKSLGNGVAPEEIIKVYGSDILRLWVASGDYKQDIRISEDILKQVSQSYMKIRNTARFLLGNLDGFDPGCDMVEEMLPLDRYAVTKLDELISSCISAYNRYEFHSVYHTIYNFCVVSLSNFYLDAVKDRLYCDESGGIARRSAQTALWLILDALTRLIAPLLWFTSDEIWQHMTHADGDDARNVLLNDITTCRHKRYVLCAEATDKWRGIEALRDEINAKLESARADKLIGKPLEASVTITTDGDEYALCEWANDALCEVFIVSEVILRRGERSITVARATHEKCERCWAHRPTVGKKAPDLCERCANTVGA